LGIVVSMTSQSALQFLSAFDARDFCLPPAEIIAHEATLGGQTNLLHHGIELKSN
jgi:hypothetical protein